MMRFPMAAIPRFIVAGISLSLCTILAPLELFAQEDDPMTYGEALTFLAKHTDVVELMSESGARVAVCPEWQGRVMTSTDGGEDEPSFGFIFQSYIESGEFDPHFNNYGGEDRFWLSPEGGDFSLWFAPGVEQTLDDWYTPPGFNVGPFEPMRTPTASQCTMRRRMELTNTAGTEFKLVVTRTIRMLDGEDIAEYFGDEAAQVLTGDGVSLVGYESINEIANAGPPMKKKGGLLSVWILGMYNPGDECVVMLPYKKGPESNLGPIVKSDYFGQVPPDRLKITQDAVLLMADTQWRSKIGVSQLRATPLAGSIDFERGILTLVTFNMPEDPNACDYMNNMWETPTEVPYRGDVVNSYNDGPTEPGGEPLGGFYELETLSQARELQHDESLTHRHTTLHIRADEETLASIARTVLGVELDDVREAMFGE